MKKIKILVVDDMESIREYYKTLFNESAECECVGEACDEKDAVEKVASLKPDIILLDIQMDRIDSGIRIIPDIIRISPKTKIIMLTVSEDNHLVFEAIRLGATEYIIKTTPLDVLTQTIIKVNGNDNYLRIDTAHRLIDEFKVIESTQNTLLSLFPKFATLTATEIEILRSLCDGLSTSKIAKMRFVEQATIKNCQTTILKKLGYKKTKEMINQINKINLFDLLDGMVPVAK